MCTGSIDSQLMRAGVLQSDDPGSPGIVALRYAYADVGWGDAPSICALRRWAGAGGDLEIVRDRASRYRVMWERGLPGTPQLSDLARYGRPSRCAAYIAYALRARVLADSRT